MDVRLEGLVLRTQDLGERDRIISVLTRDRGRVDLLARSARTSYKRFGGHLELFNTSELIAQYKEGRDLQTLKEARAIRTRQAITADLGRFAVASYAAEVALKTAPQDAPDAEAFAVLEELLGALERAAADQIEALLRRVQLRLLHARGLLPELHRCAGCGAALGGETPAWLTLPDVVPLCGACRGGSPRAEPVSGGTLEWMCEAARRDVDELRVPDPRVLSESRGVLRDAVRGMAGRLRSEEFLDQMLR